MANWLICIGSLRYSSSENAIAVKATESYVEDSQIYVSVKNVVEDAITKAIQEGTMDMAKDTIYKRTLKV